MNKLPVLLISLASCGFVASSYADDYSEKRLDEATEKTAEMIDTMEGKAVESWDKTEAETKAGAEELEHKIDDSAQQIKAEQQTSPANPEPDDGPDD